MEIDFSGKRVLVTGATRGIGKQIANDFYKLGAEVLGTGTKADEVQKLNQNSDPRIRYHQLDFFDEGSTRHFLKYIEQLDRVDICVNNAGTTRVSPVDGTSDQDWSELVALNLRGPFLIVRAVVPIMKKLQQGRIINISSIWGHLSNYDRSATSATKFGLRGFTLAGANDLARHNILMNEVAPGWTMTDLNRKLMTDEDLKAAAAKIPLQRLADPSEISKVVLFLASELNTYIVGQSIVVDGGYVNI